MTQDQLAEKSRLSRHGINKLEQGQREPNWPSVLALAEALGVSVEAFVAEGQERSAAPRVSQCWKVTAGAEFMATFASKEETNEFAAGHGKK
jgi:transcriptional regulator with XRE-family HTH domain